MINYGKDIFDGIFSVFVSLKSTFKQFFTPFGGIKHHKELAPEKNRGRLFVNWEDCVGCLLCAEACPVNCIFIDTAPPGPDEELGITSDGRKKEKWVLEFDIDMTKCLYCGLCVFPCPTGCISMSTEFNYFVYNRNLLIYHFTPFTPEQVIKKRKSLETQIGKKYDT